MSGPQSWEEMRAGIKHRKDQVLRRNQMIKTLKQAIKIQDTDWQRLNGQYHALEKIQEEYQRIVVGVARQGCMEQILSGACICWPCQARNLIKKQED